MNTKPFQITLSGCTFKFENGQWYQRAFGAKGFTWLKVATSAVPPQAMKKALTHLRSPEALRAGTQTGSLINHVTSGMRDAEPKVGMGATMLHWTDRTACTIVQVFRNKSLELNRIGVQPDFATRTDTNGMSDSQSYSYAPNVNAAIQYFTLRTNGRWVRKGESAKNGLCLKIGARNAYHDYSF